MKKSVVFVLTVVFICPLSLMASTHSLFSDNAAVQSYHAAGMPQPKPKSSSNDAAAMAKVKAIMKAAKEEEEKRQQTAAQPKAKAPDPTHAAAITKVKEIMRAAKTEQEGHQQTATQPKTPISKPGGQNKPTVQKNSNPAAIFVPQKSFNSASGGSNLSQVSRSNTLFTNHTQQKINELMNRNAALESRIEKLKEAMILLNQEVNQMNQQLVTTVAKLNTLSQQAAASAKSTQSSSPIAWLQRIKSDLGSWFNYLIYGAGSLIILLILALLFLKKGKKVTSQADSKPLEGDYDYMNSEQAIPAKLDLARSYLVMEDYASARKVLQEILLLGTEDQRQTAESMLEEIPSQS